MDAFSWISIVGERRRLLLLLLFHRGAGDGMRHVLCCSRNSDVSIRLFAFVDFNGKCGYSFSEGNNDRLIATGKLVVCVSTCSYEPKIGTNEI